MSRWAPRSPGKSSGDPPVAGARSSAQGDRRYLGRKHLRGVSDKEQRQYEHIKEEAKKEAVVRAARKRLRRAP
jgi:hypothetical protein